jgi:predicted nucleic acid-binding protein
MITLDTSAILALLDRRDPDHASMRRAVEADRGPWLVPAGILAEVAFMLQSRFVGGALSAFLVDLEAGEYTLVCGDEQLGRVRELVDRYADLPLGFSDAVVVACAEDAGGRIATLDRRDFEIVGREVPVVLVP